MVLLDKLSRITIWWTHKHTFYTLISCNRCAQSKLSSISNRMNCDVTRLAALPISSCRYTFRGRTAAGSCKARVRNTGRLACKVPAYSRGNRCTCFGGNASCRSTANAPVKPDCGRRSLRGNIVELRTNRRYFRSSRRWGGKQWCVSLRGH